jgi:hypothetical protein
VRKSRQRTLADQSHGAFGGRIAKSGLMRSPWAANLTPDPAKAPCAVRVFAPRRKLAQAPRIQRSIRVRSGEHFFLASRNGPGSNARHRGLTPEDSRRRR